MRLSVPILLASALVFALSPAPAAAQGSGAGAAGNWEITITTPQDTTVVNLALEQEGDKLTGNLSGRMGTVPVTGTSTGEAVMVDAKLDFQGMSLQLGVDGKVEGDSLNGTVKFGDFGEFPFTGKRVAATASAHPAPDAAAAPAAPATPPAPADAATIAAGAAGKWNVMLTIPGVGEIPASATLTQDPAGLVNGTLSSGAGDVAVTGTMTGTSLKLDFKATTPQGDIPVIMTGELTSAGLAGKATIVGMGEADWTATRVQ
jgi:hypothetical protein